jgi:ADP-ribosylglycohydrolase
MSLDLLDKFQGTLIAVAIGDEIHTFFSSFEDFIQEYRDIFKTYTDDTQLTIHTAKALIQGNGFNTTNFIREYVSWFWTWFWLYLFNSKIEI